MKKFYFIFTAIILGSLIWASLPTNAKAVLTPPFGGEYVNLYGSGTSANFHSGTACNPISGTCNGAFVLRTVCEGKVTNCDASHDHIQPISESSGASKTLNNPFPGFNKTVQIDVFNKQCRDASGIWTCGMELPIDYLVWYTGNPTPTAAPTPQTEMVTTCKNERITRAQLQSELRGAGYPGPWNLNDELAAYQRAACPASPTPTQAPQPTATPTQAPQPTITPTRVPTIAPVPTVAAINADVRCPSGFTRTISGSNIICLQQIQNQTQSAFSSANASTGPINVSLAGVPQGAVQFVPVEAKQPVIITQELPKTGLPLVAWAFSGLAPLGLKIKRFGSTTPEGNSVLALWQEREYLKN